LLRQEEDFDVIFVDNGSEDETPSVCLNVRSESSRPCRVLRLSCNCGWSCGNNRGAIASRDVDYFFVMDSLNASTTQTICRMDPALGLASLTPELI